MQELVIMKRSPFSTRKEFPDGFFLPYPILKEFADLKGGRIIGKNGVYGEGCDIQNKYGTIVLKNIRRDDTDLVQAVKSEIRSDDTSVQLGGVCFKIVRIPDGSSWKIVGSESKDEMVIWKDVDENLDEAFVHQHFNQFELFHLHLDTLEKYVDQNHNTRIIYTVGTKERPKKYTQFLNVNGSIVATKDLGRKNPKMIRALKETSPALKQHIHIKKVWRKPVVAHKLTDCNSFEILIPEKE